MELHFLAFFSLFSQKKKCQHIYTELSNCDMEYMMNHKLSDITQSAARTAKRRKNKYFGSRRNVWVRLLRHRIGAEVGGGCHLSHVFENSICNPKTACCSAK